MDLLGAIGGGIGLINSLTQGKQGSEYEGLARAFLDKQQKRGDQIWENANSYNPNQEADMARAYASDNATNSLQRTLSNMGARFSAAGGQPGGDTAYKVNVQNAVNQTGGELAGAIANAKLQSWQRKQNALMSALSAMPGSIGSTYFDMAGRHNQAAQAGIAGATGVLGGALDGLFKKPGSESNPPRNATPTTGFVPGYYGF